eukprot:scpid68481/ scgid14478/ 
MLSSTSAPAPVQSSTYYRPQQPPDPQPSVSCYVPRRYCVYTVPVYTPTRIHYMYTSNEHDVFASSTNYYGYLNASELLEDNIALNSNRFILRTVTCVTKHRMLSPQG